MTRKQLLAIALGAALGVAIAVGVALWQLNPSDAEVRRTVVTTLQQEAGASFLVTGTLDITTTIRIDSMSYVTPAWLTSVLQATNPGLLAYAEGSTAATVRVPGRVSYGFDVSTLSADQIDIRGDTVGVALPALRVHSVEPDLAKLQLQTESQGWMRVFPSDAHQDVRDRALADVNDTFRTQAQAHLDSATQPRIHTARALATLLTPPLRAAGVSEPQFRIRVADDLVLTPDPARPPQGALDDDAG